MIITKIRIRNFQNHKDTEIPLPRRGFVLITGPNGHGKSSLSDAVSYALGGRTIREETPWLEGQDGEVRIEGFDVRKDREVSIVRTANRSGKVEVSIDGDQYTTATKGTAQIEEMYGTHEGWLRSSVFSGADLTSFASANPTKRTELLEQFIGIDGFDSAIKLAKSDQRLLATYQAADQNKLVGLESEMDDLEAELATVRSDSSVEDVEELRKQLKRAEQDEVDADDALVDCRKRLETVGESITRKHDEQSSCRASISLLDSKLQVLGQRLAVVPATGAECPTCSQTVASEIARSLQDQIVKQRTDHETDKSALEKELSDIRERIYRLEQVRTQLREEIQRNEGDQKKARDLVSDLKTRVAIASSKSEDGKNKAEDIKAKLRTKDQQAQELDQRIIDRGRLIRINAEAQRALAPRGGVRSYVVARTLGALERSTNSYLARLFPAAQVRFSPSRELGNGTIVDEIDCQISGVGGGRGFGALSTGQRKRVNFAVLLGLGMLARGARGPSTLWFDEVLDGLDDDGIEAVCEMVRTLSREVPIVVISHRDELLERLAREAVEWLDVQNGQVFTRSTRTVVEPNPTNPTDGDKQDGSSEQSDPAAKRVRKKRASEKGTTTPDAGNAREGAEGRSSGRRGGRARRSA